MTLESRKELYAPLTEPLQILLNKFLARHNNRRPAAVLFYRDGVGQSQIDAVRVHEVPILRAVFGDDMPMAVVLVTKRHHVRLYKVTRAERERVRESERVRERERVRE